jgi:peptidyl-prolyl cis-trans isomerase SDCCAG10
LDLLPNLCLLHPLHAIITTPSDARKAELERIESEVRKLTRRRDSDDEEEEAKSTKKPRTSGPSLIELQNAQYKRGSAAAKRQGRKKDESDILATLSSFRGKLQNMRGDSPPAPSGEGMEVDQPREAAGLTAEGGEGGGGGGEGGLEVDDDVEWLSHRLHFPKDDGQESARAEHDYEVIDPRARGARAKEEERARKKDAKEYRRDGGRGYRPPAPRDRERDHGFERR